METNQGTNQGTITTYTTKGWGIISTIEQEGKWPEECENFWFHVSSVENKEEPIVGQVVSFSISPVRAGRHRRAEKIAILK